MPEPLRNWAGNYTYRAARLHVPDTIDQVQALVRRSRQLKVLGTRHAFNAIADSAGDLVSLKHFNRVVGLDPEQRTVTIEAGVRYGELCRYLHSAGYALPNLASLPHISVAGACATATHGSGDRLGTLATAVRALEMVTAAGDVVSRTREQHGEEFSGMVVSLGALGVVTKLTLDLVPAFDMCQRVYEDLPFATLEVHMDTITDSGYSVSLFTDWRSATFNQVWVKRRVADDDGSAAERSLFGAPLATGPRHPIAGLPTENCTEQLGVPGPWYARLPHFRLAYTPSSGAELQSEYLVPRPYALDALRAIERLRPQIVPLLQISEVRTVAADDLWLSPAYQHACVAIHFTWKPEWPAVSGLLPRLEAALEPFAARPHWGKLFTLDPARLEARYPKLPAFHNLLRAYDPHGKFRNPFLERYVLGAPDGGRT
jgi:alditol oxidase